MGSGLTSHSAVVKRLAGMTNKIRVSLATIAIQSGSMAADILALCAAARASQAWRLCRGEMMTNNTNLLGRREAAVPRGVATALPVFADRALNAELWDVEGRRFIDFARSPIFMTREHVIY